MKTYWLTSCFLAFLADRARYAPTHPFYPKDYETFLTDWINNFCND